VFPNPNAIALGEIKTSCIRVSLTDNLSLLPRGISLRKGEGAMLSVLFLICAVVGGALVLAQLLLSVAAFGAGHGARLHHRVGGSVAAHRGGAVRASVAQAVHQHRGNMRASAPRGVRSTGRGGKQNTKAASPRSDAGAVTSHWGHWAMAWVLGILNFQGIVSGVTVFGLVGLAASAGKRPGPVAVELGVAAAVVMMAAISGMLSMMTSMDRDATVDLQQATGQPATVYLGIPAKNEGLGKVTLSLQQRLMEFPAVTFQDDPLLTGQKVVIVAVLDTGIMLVVSAEKYAEQINTLKKEPEYHG
jgi:hypothetical protein